MLDRVEGVLERVETDETSLPLLLMALLAGAMALLLLVVLPVGPLAKFVGGAAVAAGLAFWLYLLLRLRLLPVM